ncbi:MAG: hypothetical protein A2945_03870 [Candidatus Liptonbacteria bacterium RIFCSPLOWO2_01_FULL_52_25]|uniref:Uncharacterized protein n=1 Tax=Candidatus Liptonbacteria bacterium RIFCSPLOWO2_01_FULL_52_25 TaxID=1798650 RepID=A0A1G2CIG5_9BACT|nr:MAG: hypothetical protein A2945_03870 [Candidatus Liptonbacteria bacterium RIFCSPLOWO2_01_FULL_52_25]
MALRKRKFNPERRVSLRSVTPKKVDEMLAAIEKNPAVRYVITDDAGNKSVLMSPQTYEFLKKCVNMAFAYDAIAQAVLRNSKPLPVELL